MSNYHAPEPRHEPTCRFCALLAGKNDTFDSVWLRGEHFQAMVSIGALIPGWTLLVPRDHATNMSDAYERSEFWEFAGAAAETVESTYGQVTLFEHGPSHSASLTGCGVDHAHTHLVPLRFSLEALARLEEPELRWEDCRVDEVRARANGCEYLYVASDFNGSSTQGSIARLEQPTSQFFRKLIARQTGLAASWDYKLFPMLEVSSGSAARLRAQAGATELESAA